MFGKITVPLEELFFIASQGTLQMHIVIIKAERIVPMIGLDKLEVGETAFVAATEEKRLCDLGLVKGTKVRCILKSPLGDPKAYLFRDSVIAIRKTDAKKIQVEVANFGGN